MSHTLFQSLRPAVVASLPPTPNREKIADSYEQRLAALLASREFIDREAALYAKYLSDEDVKALSDFYQTSAGQHFNDATAQLTNGLPQAGSVWALFFPAYFFLDFVGSGLSAVNAFG